MRLLACWIFSEIQGAFINRIFLVDHLFLVENTPYTPKNDACGAIYAFWTPNIATTGPTAGRIVQVPLFFGPLK